jgi:uncharacterized membrane protein YraQ (UPF0718 family)
MKKWIKRYRVFLIIFTLAIIILIFKRELGMKAFSITGNSIKEMLLVIPPIFILLGLLDVWVPRETMVKYMGEGSGLKGILLSIFIGSAAAGPLYGAFPVAAVFMKKGVKFMNILIFIGAWSTTKIPMFLFELASLGSRFAISRLLIDIPGIIIIAFLISKMVSREEIDALYENANSKQ